MCRPTSTCPFAAALFGSVSGSAAGAVVGAIAGWLLSAGYVVSGGVDSLGVAPLIFGTLGMGIGGSGGAVGGMIEGWCLAGGNGPAEGSAAKWGAILGILWGLQPILWLAFQVDAAQTLKFGLVIALAVAPLGAVAGLLGGLTARQVVRAFGVVRPASIPIGKKN